jgi:2-dehydro-3-deoxygalactonokinase
MLIGLELAGARGWWQGRPVAIVGAERLSGLYARALAAQGVVVRRLSARDTVLAGLSAMFRSAVEKAG